jgi:hypothetical protein
MHAYKQPCSTTTKDTEKACTKATNKSSERRMAHNKNISLCATMFNITRTPRKKRMHKNTKGKLKKRLCMQPCSITKPPRKKACTKTQKESSKREHA